MEVIVLQHLGQVFPFPRPSTPSSSFLSRFGQHECLPPQTPHSHPVRFLHLISSWAFFPVPGCHPTISSQEKTQTLGLSAQGKLRHTEGGGVSTSRWSMLGWERQARACDSLCPPSGCLHHTPEPAPSVPSAQAAALGSPCSSGKGNVFPFPSRSARQQRVSPVSPACCRQAPLEPLENA